MASAVASPQIQVSASARQPVAPMVPTALGAPPAAEVARAHLALPSRELLQRFGWTLIGTREGSIKGCKVTTMLASREGMRAEIKRFHGYPHFLQDMLELKGAAEGFAEMTMITVLVKGDPAKTDQLYEQLMGRAPERHGSGLGFEAK